MRPDMVLEKELPVVLSDPHVAGTESLWIGVGFLIPQGPTPVTDFIQQDHTSSPSYSATLWCSSIQIPEPKGATLPSNLHSW